MKQVLTAIFLTIALTASAQFDIFNATVQKVGNKYIVTDTSGTDASQVIYRYELDSIRFIQNFFSRVNDGLRQTADYQVQAKQASLEVSKYQALLQSQGLLNTYLQWVAANVTNSGTWRTAYNNTTTNLTFGNGGHLYTGGGTKVADVLEIAENWLRITLITMGNEVVDIYRVNGNLWWGEGVNGQITLTR